MRLDTTHPGYERPRRPGRGLTPYALVWARTYGKGRVFYSAFWPCAFHLG